MSDFISEIRQAIGAPDNMEEEALLTTALFYINEGKKKVIGLSENNTRGDLSSILEPSNAALVLALAQLIVSFAGLLVKDNKTEDGAHGEEGLPTDSKRT